ncbi:MAG: D-alanyl-D-alanine carboxypeptidase family protein [Lachnospiraceae bacterium]|nr:D-alanyl-D-alanine carboxypeptidase family protein [Lachnospiraceae bacterium]MDO5551291.1 D-alanyl-D-alanine carboxypeptidase family protein [Lachnospiraceae bacterium]
MNRMKSYLKKGGARVASFAVSFALILQAGVFPAYGKPTWPADTGIQAEAGIVVDEETGAVLFGQNIHLPYAPASITKLLTALVVIENSPSLDDTVVFSHDAVYNVESGSGNALGLEEGDQLSVRDCLYALLLRSSNQAANALAEYVGGTREGFVAMMNEKIRSLGCTESNFANPSGLNDENQYVSAYDMAIIGRAAFANETLMEINSSTTYRLPSTINNPEGRQVNMEHKLLITTDETSPNYYPAAVAGKTGFTSIAGNTLVTCAREGERSLVSVVLKSNQTHYTDTIALLNFGFQNFQNLDATGDEATLFGAEGTLTIGDQTYQREELEVQGSRLVTVPTGATLADVDRELVTGEEMDAWIPEDAVAEIRYTYDERVVGRSYFVSLVPDGDALLEVGAGEDALNQNEGEDGVIGPGSSSDVPAESGKPMSPETKALLVKVGLYALAAALLAAAAALIVFHMRKVKREREEAAQRRRERRRQRLAEIGCSEDEFKRMVNERYGKKDKE